MTTTARVDVSLEALSSVCADGIAFVGRDGRVAMWNDAASEITGVPSKRAVGQSFASLFPGSEPLTGLRNGEHADVKLAPPGTGLERHVNARAVGVEQGWIVSFGQQRRYAQIEQLKNEIVAAVSHELKTPIATIKAYAMTLRMSGSELEGQRDQYLATIETECDRLTEAVDDMLDAARVDAEHLLSQRVEISIASVVDEAAARLNLDATHALERRGLDVSVSGDPDLLRSIFVHLLENAAKFSSTGSTIVVEAGRNETSVHVHVHDSGVGIPEEHVPYIFERFYRVEGALTSATPGSGLGLFVAKMLARAHGAELSVRSAVNAGSTFTLEFPVRG